MKKNEIYKSEVLDVTHEALGLCKIEGIPVFVSDALTGETVDVQILKANKKFAFGRTTHIHEKSEDRQKPPCDVFKPCGGCDLQHLKYAKQLELKKHIVENNLKRIGGFDVVVDDIIGMDNPFRYRNKVQYPVKANKVGFYAKRSNSIVEHTDCKVQSEVVNKIVNDLKHIVDPNIINIVFRTASEGIMLIFVSRKRRLDFSIDKILEKYKMIKTVVISIKREENNVILGKKNVTIYGDGYITDELLNKKYRISPRSFYQVNKTQTEVLYKKVIEYADLNKNQTVFDLYCGIGTIALSVADYAKNVIGIDSVKEAIEDANENAIINKVENVQFICNKAEVEVPKLYLEKVKADVVIIDPPRKGCDKVLINTLLEMKASKIVYVSCDSATLARDLKMLCETKYVIKNITAVDMFPHTKHVETVVLLERK